MMIIISTRPIRADIFPTKSDQLDKQLEPDRYLYQITHHVWAENLEGKCYFCRDLSYNDLTAVPAGSLSDLPYLRILQVAVQFSAFYASLTLSFQLDNNKIGCMDKASLRDLPQLVSLTLNTNNLTTLSGDLVQGLPRLQSLRLEHNKLECDCRLAWVLDHETLAPLARCHLPYSLNGRRIVELRKKAMKCDGPPAHEESCAPAVSKMSSCPEPCKCTEGIVDCRNRGLSAIPALLPVDMTEM